MRITHMRLAILAIAATLLGGCASAWERAYVPAEPVAAAAETSPDQVIVREVPWARIAAALKEMDEMVAASDTHPDDWTPEQKREAEARLLKALQIPEPPEQVKVLGRSDFSTTDRIDPRDGSLAEFAAELGADYAIWARSYQGEADRIVTEPVTTWSDRTIYFRDRHGKRRTETISGWSTTYVPIVVTADEWAWVAFFVRKD